MLSFLTENTTAPHLSPLSSENTTTPHFTPLSSEPMFSDQCEELAVYVFYKLDVLAKPEVV